MVVIFNNMLLLKTTFLSGDYLAQFYPWYKLYSQSIKSLSLPYWISYNQCGFPLFAEGQIGALYPVNILTYLLLPWKAAYSFNIVVHFFMGGIFAYAYIRKKGFTQLAGCLAAFLFCFSSAFAGCFFNIVSLRTLVWFPLALLLIDLYIENGKFRHLLISAYIISLQFLAGFAQMAAYAYLFYIFYIICYIWVYKKNYRQILKKLALFLIISSVLIILVSLPQLLASSEMASYSNRPFADINFALWGSFNPAGLVGLFFPYSAMAIGTTFFVGIFSLFFIFICFGCAKQRKDLIPLLGILILGCLLALGKFNPLYVIFIKLFKIYSLRNPSKFLFFGISACAFLAAAGFDLFFDKKYDNGLKRKNSNMYIVFLAFLTVSFVIFRWLFIKSKTIILYMVKSYTTSHIYGQPHHRYSLDYYMQKVEGLYETLLKNTSPDNIFVFFSFIIIVSCALVLFAASHSKIRAPFLRYAAFFIILADIYVFSLYGTGFKGNIKPFSYENLTHAQTLNYLSSVKGQFRICPIGPYDNLPGWCAPNTNILAGIDSVSVYSPLADSAYYKYMSDLGTVDDSAGVVFPDDHTIYESIDKLRVLNVGYIISGRELNDERLELILSEGNSRLYLLKDHLPRIFLSEDLYVSKPQKITLREFLYDNGRAIIEFNSENNGFLIFSEKYYPGWFVDVNGARQLIQKAGILQAVRITKGFNRVIFSYEPYYKKYIGLSLFFIFFIPVLIIITGIASRRVNTHA